jgi:predicted Zn-dependent peptidase
LLYQLSYGTIFQAANLKKKTIQKNFFRKILPVDSVRRQHRFVTFERAMSKNAYHIHTLSNGIRLIHKHVNSPVAHLGLFINIGSRDELVEEHGLAHLIEHMLFKGTLRRKSYYILSRMEDVGGEINAYTTKEETCIHATFFNQYYSRALELISDIAYNSVFPANELKKEREIILDEINSYKDSPSEIIFDEFEELLFDGNPLARNILGSGEALKSFSPSHIKNFITRNFSTDQMVVSSVGSIQFKELIKFFTEFFSVQVMKRLSPREPVIYNHKASFNELERNTFQTHCIIGNLAYKVTDDRRLTLYLLNNYLGGPGMNSRLNLALRERKGYAYTIDSLYTAYTDTGNITIYFGTDKNLIEKCIQIILKELEYLRDNLLSQIKLQKVKKQVLGHIAISFENNENHMLSMGKSLMIFNRVDTLKEISNKIETVSPRQMLEVANDVFDANRLSYLIYK